MTERNYGKVKKKKETLKDELYFIMPQTV